ncbi:unnamed protein product [Dibothriocephalus latus]|uniref:Uncharacterized protein n=1 Tax=Dibothriocephalus latus TaxID=60516 RepID=A0A3P6NWS3_DIBLA|nr:unnamed protein product [Dibothriocephalus latus]
MSCRRLSMNPGEALIKESSAPSRENLLKPYFDEDRCKFRHLTAEQFSDIWSHFDLDGVNELRFILRVPASQQAGTGLRFFGYISTEVYVHKTVKVSYIGFRKKNNSRALRRWNVNKKCSNAVQMCGTSQLLAIVGPHTQPLTNKLCHTDYLPLSANFA